MCYISAHVLAAVELILLVAVDCKVLHYDDVKYVYYSRTKVSEYFLLWYPFIVLEAGEICPLVFMFICTSVLFLCCLFHCFWYITCCLLVVPLSCVPYAVLCVMRSHAVLFILCLNAALLYSGG